MNKRRLHPCKFGINEDIIAQRGNRLMRNDGRRLQITHVINYLSSVNDMKPWVVHETNVPLTDIHNGGQVLGIKCDGQSSVPM